MKDYSPCEYIRTWKYKWRNLWNRR